MKLVNGLKNLIKLSIALLLLSGCATPQHPMLPDKTAVYRRANETITEPDTLWENYIDNCYYDDTIKSGEYYPGNNVIIEWERK